MWSPGKEPRWREFHCNLGLGDMYPVISPLIAALVSLLLLGLADQLFLPNFQPVWFIRTKTEKSCGFCIAWETVHDLRTAAIPWKPRCSPVTYITRPIFVCGAACSSSNPINILVTFRGVFSKINPSTKHSSYVCMSLIKPFMNNGINERRT